MTAKPTLPEDLADYVDQVFIAICDYCGHTSIDNVCTDSVDFCERLIEQGWTKVKGKPRVKCPNCNKK